MPCKNPLVTQIALSLCPYHFLIWHDVHGCYPDPALCIPLYTTPFLSLHKLLEMPFIAISMYIKVKLDSISLTLPPLNVRLVKITLLNFSSNYFKFRFFRHAYFRFTWYIQQKSLTLNNQNMLKREANFSLPFSNNYTHNRLFHQTPPYVRFQKMFKNMRLDIDLTVSLKQFINLTLNSNEI